MDAAENNPTPEMIEAAAAAWLSLRDRGLTQEETAEFMRWLQQDPQHAAVFAELDLVWKTCDRLGAVPAPAETTSLPDADLLAPRVRRQASRFGRWAGWGAAASVALLLGILFGTRAPQHTVETAVGAFQKLDLPDGSIVQLNTATAITTSFTATERRVSILRGEVFFNVAKDAKRPFVVTSGGVAVRAVGTAFNVRKRDSSIEVLVTEGRVRVDDAREGRSLLPLSAAQEPSLLVAGERAVVSSSSNTQEEYPLTASVEKVDSTVTQRTLAWQERRLEFDDAPLAEVITEFNRYNRRQLVIADATLAKKRFSGTFRADGYEPLVRLLETDFNVTAVRTDREIVLRAVR
jgi:transmembrane sensor